MSLLDNILGEAGKNKVAAKNRVALILDAIEGTEDHATLVTVLADKRYTNAVLTRALRTEYGENAVKSGSVREYRNNHLHTVDGL